MLKESPFGNGMRPKITSKKHASRVMWDLDQRFFSGRRFKKKTILVVYMRTNFVFFLEINLFAKFLFLLTQVTDWLH